MKTGGCEQFKFIRNVCTVPLEFGLINPHPLRENLHGSLFEEICFLLHEIETKQIKA